MLRPTASRALWPRLVTRLRHGEVRRDVFVLGALLTLVIFAIDMILPLGVAGGVPYIAPVLLAMWLPDRRLIIVVATVCTVLAAAGLWLSPLGAELSVAVPNRILAITAIWTVGLLAFQRKGFELALSESEATNRAILATTADGIVTLDERGTILTVNPAVELIFGHSEAELLGQPFTALLDAAQGELFRRDRDEYLARSPTDEVVTHEMIGRRRDGSTLPVEVVPVPVPHEDGVRYTVTLRDVSERRRLEQYLLRRTDEERRAIGHSLHEEVGQGLTGLALISRQLARRLAGRDAAEAREVSDLAELLHELDVQALKLFVAVAPVDARGGLADALAELVRAAAERYEIPHTIVQDAPLTPIDELASAQTYDVVRELLEFCMACGDVRRVDFQVGEAGGFEILFQGFEATRRPGLAPLVQRLRYRARLVGAHLETHATDEGLRLMCTWPHAVSAGDGHPAAA